MPRFVILEHDHPFPHLDFMLEHEGKLRTWRLLAEPKLGQSVPAEALGDHRIEYLDYEGPLTGNRGRVKRRDSGTFEWLIDEPDTIVVQVVGKRIIGRIELDCRPQIGPAS